LLLTENTPSRLLACTCDVLVRLIVDDTVESHVTSLDDDADRLLNTQGILFKRWISVDGAEKPPRRSWPI
jgi:hypothetical protein